MVKVALIHAQFETIHPLGVATAAVDAEQNIIEVASLVATDRRRLLQSAQAGPSSYRLFEMLPMMPRTCSPTTRYQLPHGDGCSAGAGRFGHRDGDDRTEKEPELQLPGLR